MIDGEYGQVSSNFQRNMLIAAAVLIALLFGVIGYMSNQIWDNPPDGTETIAAETTTTTTTTSVLSNAAQTRALMSTTEYPDLITGFPEQTLDEVAESFCDLIHPGDTAADVVDAFIVVAAETPWSVEEVSAMAAASIVVYCPEKGDQLK